MKIKRDAAVLALTGAFVLGIAATASAGTSGWTGIDGWRQTSAGIISWQKSSLGGGAFRASVSGPNWPLSIKAHFVLLGVTHTTGTNTNAYFSTVTADHMSDYNASW
ncbi:MAG: hypothetical protein NVV57_07235 [Demequina sp.]|jgi:hypothetical protein|nr:hypothetical protein [Demequina sp.]